MKDKAKLLDEVIASELALVEAIQRDFGEDTGSGALNQLSTALIGLDSAAREKLQELTRADVARIVSALAQGGDLSDADRELVRVWMIGDADAYVKMENDFESWVAELRRLLKEVATRGRTPSADALASLRGTIRDALRTISDIHFYKEMQERVGHFESSAAGWSERQKQLLAVMLEQKLRSGEM